MIADWGPVRYSLRVGGISGGVLAVIDAANVVGSVPDGWWRDPAGATEQLRDALAAAGPAAVPGASDDAEVVLVVEGPARGVQTVPGVRVVAAPGEGDDAIVELLQREGTGTDIVVTADRGLRERVEALGARVVGPRRLRLPDYWRRRLSSIGRRWRRARRGHPRLRHPRLRRVGHRRRPRMRRARR
jgi:hypothetical protein